MLLHKSRIASFPDVKFNSKKDLWSNNLP